MADDYIQMPDPAPGKKVRETWTVLNEEALGSVVKIETANITLGSGKHAICTLYKCSCGARGASACKHIIAATERRDHGEILTPEIKKWKAWKAFEKPMESLQMHNEPSQEIQDDDTYETWMLDDHEGGTYTITLRVVDGWDFYRCNCVHPTDGYNSASIGKVCAHTAAVRFLRATGKITGDAKLKNWQVYQIKPDPAETAPKLDFSEEALLDLKLLSVSQTDNISTFSWSDGHKSTCLENGAMACSCFVFKDLKNCIHLRSLLNQEAPSSKAMLVSSSSDEDQLCHASILIETWKGPPIETNVVNIYKDGHLTCACTPWHKSKTCSHVLLVQDARAAGATETELCYPTLHPAYRLRPIKLGPGETAPKLVSSSFDEDRAISSYFWSDGAASTRSAGGNLACSCEAFDLLENCTHIGKILESKDLAVLLPPKPFATALEPLNEWFENHSEADPPEPKVPPTRSRARFLEL